MRKELLHKREQVSKLIEDINIAVRSCSKEEGYKLMKIKEEKLKEWHFLNELLKAL